ncbi:MAG: hypothetical protein ISS88_02880 [Candidatus Portnoybacteria bacterium]|nr:hypothetical protein [Candidatus Portnoybacteria bacterium]
MNGMDKKRNGRERLFILADDLGEWVQLLIEKGRADSKLIWFNLNTKKVMKLIEELLQEFEEYFKSASGKINGAEKTAFQKIKIESQEALDSFRKEHRR